MAGEGNLPYVLTQKGNPRMILITTDPAGREHRVKSRNNYPYVIMGKRRTEWVPVCGTRTKNLIKEIQDCSDAIDAVGVNGCKIEICKVSSVES